MYLPVIMLHHVLDSPHPTLAEWALTRSKFTEMLDCIEEAGLTTTTFEQIVENNLSLSELHNHIVITFDDCPVALFDFAIPELIRRGMKAVFYMPTAHMGAYNIWDVENNGAERVDIMNGEQINQLVALGMEVGSHSHHHVELGSLTEEDAYHEIYQSKKILEETLNRSIYSIAYPYGDIPLGFKTSLKKAGYKFGLAIYSPRQHIFSLRRIGIYQSDDKKAIAFKISRSFHSLRNLASPIVALKKFYLNKKG
ncbi:polysaccharide deacetylase family protein [Pedobacter endophyticus]|uniref:Polysaccharide deacetylase family protein n=1 Tax=Pedobacter endophyticus TaxID=2789740 RepID=A0A7S9L0J7_9SPHI|nr:polysaccharide deacetylase family protein [Pedobacter endophyticus]QPH39941.1 polysaccharide deacetylase family protein [Pedobacter endophyticus]